MDLIKSLAETNMRGISSSDIVCEIQSLREQIEESSGEHHYYLLCRFNHLLNELERRSRLNDKGIRTTNNEIIQTIKEKIKIEDVLAWYTDVYYHNKNWTYRCTLHGKDSHPSGKIYIDQSKAWCHVCNQGGDIFDIVQLFERMELNEAIKKLANYIGLELKPFNKRPTDHDERLRQVELKTDHLLKGRKTTYPYTEIE
jgi:hypothetical protein